MVTRKDDDDRDRKERVIHTRVPERLETELRERAEGLGISVSNLVRNVLGHAFGLVGDVAADAHAIARAARGDRERVVPTTTPPTVDDVLGWQPIVLGKNAVCARCNEILPKGRDAALGIAEHGGCKVIVCVGCLEEVRS
ncbi:MAG: hypothetical protein NT062_27325 [Proteobacteria bacterium]|nr:hypothetical protein [Pseudomonadota bacterium]